MKITSITYTVSLTPPGNFESGGATRTMEATAQLEDGVCPDLELERLVDHVHRALGKPTTAEAKAMKLLAPVEKLWVQSYGERASAERERRCATNNREAAGRHRQNGGTNVDYIENCEKQATSQDESAAAHDAKAAKLQERAEIREQEPAVRAARALLRRPKPEPDVTQDDNDDDIPF